MAEVVSVTLKSDKTDLQPDPSSEYPYYLLDPSSKFVAKMEKKYNIAYYWNFRVDGTVGFDENNGDEMYGDPADHIRAFLETCRHYDFDYSGTVSYVLNGNVSMVYIFGAEGKATIFTLNAKKRKTVSSGGTPVKTLYISLDE